MASVIVCKLPLPRCCQKVMRRVVYPLPSRNCCVLRVHALEMKPGRDDVSQQQQQLLLQRRDQQAEGFQWTRQWYPVAVMRDLEARDARQPYPVQVRMDLETLKRSVSDCGWTCLGCPSCRRVDRCGWWWWEYETFGGLALTLRYCSTFLKSDLVVRRNVTGVRVCDACEPPSSVSFPPPSSGLLCFVWRAQQNGSRGMSKCLRVRRYNDCGFCDCRGNG